MALLFLNLFISATCLVPTWLVPLDQGSVIQPAPASSLSSFLERPFNLQTVVMPLFTSHSPRAKHTSTHPSVENHPRGSAQEVQTPSSRTRLRRSLFFQTPTHPSASSRSLIPCIALPAALALASCVRELYSPLFREKPYPWGCQSRAFQ